MANTTYLTPVTRVLRADMETPLSAYWKLAHDEPLSFLLESVTGGEQLARYSLMGVRPHAVVRSHQGRVMVADETGSFERSLRPDEDPLHEVEARCPQVPIADAEGLPRLCGGAVGLIAYDFVRFLERIPDDNLDDLGLDDVAFMITHSLVIFDHALMHMKLLALSDGTPEGDAAARAELDRLEARLTGPLPSLPATKTEPPAMYCNFTQEEFEDRVQRVVEYVKAGDGVQFVPSIRWEGEFKSHPLTLYRALRGLNPSPYMYLLRFGDLDVVGASPELLVGLKGREARVRPIAGTRKRGRTQAEDDALAAELLADEKETSEHVMLIDLGRNDLGRVCDFGSVRVDDLMVIERYSHVMHIVSNVVGNLREGMSAYDLVRATFPAGTLSGAPKVRALAVIDEMEKTRRGLYGGAVGYFGACGDTDLAIAIRSILIRNGRAYVQAGAGIVYDSVPASEWQECHNKAGAPLAALALAHSGLDA